MSDQDADLQLGEEPASPVLPEERYAAAARTTQRRYVSRIDEHGREHWEVKEIETAPLKYAVHYHGPWETLHDGVQRAVRAHARALSDAGVPVLLESFSRMVTNRQGHTEMAVWGMVEEEVMREVGELVLTEATHIVPRIKHIVNGLGADQLLSLLAPRRLSDCATYEESEQKLNWWLSWTVAFTVWETTTVDDEVAGILARCAQCWVPSDCNRQALIASGVPESKVFTVPHPYDPHGDIRKLGARPARPAPLAGMVDAERRFYAVGKWEPRKCYPETLLAFLLAFRPGDSASLVLKTSRLGWRGYLGVDELLPRLLKEQPVKDNGWTTEALSRHVRIITDVVSDAELLELHYRSNIYVSAAVGEGYGLPAFDAVVAGNRLIYVGGTGPETFARETDYRIAPEGEAPAHPAYGWGDRKTQRMGLAALVAALRGASRPQWGALEPPDARFSKESVGALMRGLILQMGSPESKRCLANGGREP